MLRDEDIRVDTGRAAHGGDFLRMVHVPTGIERVHAGPLAGVDIVELRRRWLTEIQREIESRNQP